MPFGFGKSKDKKASKAQKEAKKHPNPSPVHRYPSVSEEVASNSPSPASSTSELVSQLVGPKQNIPLSRVESSGTLVRQHRDYYETLTRNSKSPARPNSGQFSDQSSPEKHRRVTDTSLDIDGSNPSQSSSRISVSVYASPPPAETPLSRTTSGHSSGQSSLSPTPSHGNYTPTNKRSSFLESLSDLSSSDTGREKTFDGVHLTLPPLQTTNVRLRDIEATKNAPGGGFGFILRKSYLPVPEDPDKTRLVHLVEPRTDYLGPLMTGDRIIEVNGMNVEEELHEAVVEMIKSSGDGVYLRVASMPELLELNARGALDDTLQRSNQFRKSGRGKAKHGTGTLRRQNKTKFKAKTEEEVLSEKEGLEHDKVWVVHSRGFSLGTVNHNSPQRNQLTSHYSRLQGREKLQVKLSHSEQLIEVEEDDIEKANPSSLDKVEDLVHLVHLNESSVLHVLRQRYGSSLIHTFAGKHLIVLNPLKPLSSYVDRVIDMFRGCRRADMPPHIFAMGQQAYRDMMVTHQDQSLILMGLSGSGKTFNARYLLRYLTTVGQPDQGPVSNARLDAVELLLHSFGSAATFLNPQATRCTCLYTLDFDPSGTIVSAAVRTYLLEKFRIAQRPDGEGNFNILYQLIAGADDQLRTELLLNGADEEAEEPNLYYESLDDPQRNESAAYVWDLIQNCLDILDITEEEALGIWSLLAAIYHLGYAGVKKGQVRGSDCFQNPAAAQRAAAVLGINHEVLGHYIFSPPRGQTSFHNSLTASSPTQSETTSITSSLFLANLGGNRSLFLDAFVMGLYDQAVNALVMLINRALQGSPGNKRTSSIHVVDMPGFQHRELAGARNGASLDDLCMNYAQERLQMLFHDWTFTSEQDRYIQEEINWMFSEMAASPLPVIDTIDRHVPQRRGGAVDVHADRRGLLWILDEESVFPGATDSSFLDRVQMYHGNASSMGDTPLVKVIREDNQFSIFHCQRTLSVLYDANGWVKRAREHPSFRVVVQVMAESKRQCVASVFQGRGVAASATTLGNSQLKADTHHRSLSRSTSSQMGGIHYSGPASGIKKTSLCLQTKFQLDFLMDTLRKTHQWFIRCILPQLPHKLPGALPRPTSTRAPNDDGPTQGYIDVPLVRSQIRRAELVKAARIYKQGYPEHMSFSEFRRRYVGLLTQDTVDGSVNGKQVVSNILSAQEVDVNSFKVGLSQAFFRAGTLARLDRQVEDSSHDTMVLFQARCRGWLGRQKFQKLQVQDSAALVIQQNVWSYLDMREWSWWKLYLKIKPMLAIWRAEEEIKDRDGKLEKLKTKCEALENERDALKESESLLEEKVTQLSARLSDIQSSANEASDLMENEQMEKREMEEQLVEATARETEIAHENEQLKLQIAEMSILARIKNDHSSDNSETVMEKYLETRRELETLRQRVSSEYEDEVERLESAKKKLEKRLADSENEQADLHKTLSQVRKKAAKYGSEMNDLKLLLEQQQARNAELEKRQRKFDTDLNACKEDASTEVLAKEQLAREKDLLHTEHDELKTKLKELKEENKRILQEKEDLESEVLTSTTSVSTESELTSLKRMKRDMEAKIEELEDELDESNVKLDTLQQTKARLELSNQTLKQQHQQELEGREQELEQIKNTMTKKLKAVSQQLEEVHEEKHAAVKARRDMERDLLEYQSKIGDPEMEKKLRKQLKKVKALYQDTQEQLEHEREMRSNSAMVKSLRNQLEDLQTSETSAVKAQKRLQGEVDELQVQCDELSRTKIELESKVSDLSREKNDLESRVEEDQDEIDELLEKQRSHISQTTSLQAQLTEANIQVDDLEDAKQTLEAKVEAMGGVGKKNVAPRNAFPSFPSHYVPCRPHLTAMFVRDYWENKPCIMRELRTIISCHGLAIDHQRKVVKRTLGGGVVGQGGQTFTICGDFGMILGVYVVPDTALSWAEKAMSEVVDRHTSIGVAVPKFLYVDCGCCGGKEGSPSNVGRMGTSIGTLWRSIFSFKLDAMHLMLRIGREINAEHPRRKKFLTDLSLAIFMQHDGDRQQLEEAREVAGLDGPPTRTERVKFIRRVVGDPGSVAKRMELVLKAHRELDRQSRSQAEAAGMEVDNLTVADVAYPLVTQRLTGVFQQQLIHVRNGCISDDPENLPYSQVGTINFHLTGLRMNHYQSLRGTSKVEAVHSVLDRTFYSQRGIGAEVFDARLGWWILGYNRRRMRAHGNKVPPDSLTPKVCEHYIAHGLCTDFPDWSIAAAGTESSLKIGYDYGRLVTGEEQQVDLSEELELETAETTDTNQVVPDPLEDRTMVATSNEIQDLTSKISEVESGVNRHQYEASEMKVKELEQKLELERSSARRHESQIHRLRNQLERVQEEKSESVSHQSSDALKRLQKQIRDIRLELQEAERKEQEQSKKKRIAEARVEELEAQIQSSKADLKNAQKRIETLHGALKGHEAYSDDDIQDDTFEGYDDEDDDDLSSNASSYKVGELDEMSVDDLSDTEGSGLLDETPPVRTRTWERSNRSQSRDLTPRIEEEEEVPSTRRQRKLSVDSMEDTGITLTKYNQKDNNENVSKHRDSEEDIKPKKNISSRVEDDILTEPDDKYSLKPRETASKGSSLPRAGRRPDLYDEEDEDDDDLEEFLLRQRERTRRLQDEGDSFEPIVRSRKSKSPSRIDDTEKGGAKSNGKLATEDMTSREGSEVSLGGGEGETARQRRKRQRRRTIEQLSSPEHQAAKSNGGV